MGTCGVGTFERHRDLNKVNDPPVLNDREREHPQWHRGDLGYGECLVSLSSLLGVVECFGAQRELETTVWNETPIWSSERIEQAEVTISEAGRE